MGAIAGACASVRLNRTAPTKSSLSAATTDCRRFCQCVCCVFRLGDDYMHLLCTQFEAGVPVVHVQMIAEIMVGRADSHRSIRDFLTGGDSVICLG